ncbi:MAG: beta-phosphoglucomutase family hydrolase [Spirochaetia bacterium]
MSSYECRGGVFDLDGVITHTAKTHFKAWKQTFDTYLEKKGGEEGKNYSEFDYENDYLPYVDGKPRYQGVRSFLESRDINLPFGDPDDPPDMETVCGIGNRKNEAFRESVKNDGVEVFRSTVDLIKKLKDRGAKVGVASSSKNCKFILKETNLIDLFDTVVGGIVSKELELKGKPEPDIFIVAAENMGLQPKECFIVEDALAGVQAGRNGNFALVIGINREGLSSAEMYNSGADVVKPDMEEITIKDIEEWFATGLEKAGWNLSYRGYEPQDERLREALTTIGNGYFGTRGCIVNEDINDDIHYPGTYIAGIFDKRPTQVHGEKIYNNDFVNCPNWLSIKFRIGDGPFQKISEAQAEDYIHDLNMRNAVMSRSYTITDGEGRKTRIETRRFACITDPHAAYLRYELIPLNYSEPVTVRSGIEGRVKNYGVERYRDLEQKHIEPIGGSVRDHIITLGVRTIASKHDIFMSSRHTLSTENFKKEVVRDPAYIALDYTFQAKENKPVVLDKTTAIYTSLGTDSSQPEEDSVSTAEKAPGFDEALEKHAGEWKDLWTRAHITIEGDRFAQKTLRLNAYHMLVTASRHNMKMDVGIPARGLHGEAYRGHIFWDEVFFLPFYNIRFPGISQSHLMYRYRRLDNAREYARENGYEGAMFPWQTADTGEEESQDIHYNPKSGKWDPDLSRKQRHISISIAYNIWSYFYVADDWEFLHGYGMEMLLEICRFWAGIAEYDESDGRYHIEGVMGPDEFHEKYLHAEEGGFRDNGYTNVMVVWLLHKAIETYEHLPEEIKKKMSDKIGFDREEITRWEEITHKMKVVMNDDKLIEQFDGYTDLEELDFEEYRRKYGNIQRLDRILKAEGNSPDKYQVAKQADVLMMFYLLSPGQVAVLLERLGYEPGDPKELLRTNYEYYIKRTTHGSTLSYIVHSAILKYLDTHHHDQMRWYRRALESDLYDIQGGTSLEGIHTGVMGGSLDIAVKTFAGLNFFRDHVEMIPCMPRNWDRIKFRMVHRDNIIDVDITHERAEFIMVDQRGGEFYIRWNGDDYRLEDGKVTVNF